MLAGFLFRAGNLYGLVPALTRFGELAVPVALAATAALVLYLAVYLGAFAMLATAYGVRRRGAPVVLAGTWVGLELLQGRLFGGFPWCLLGYAAGRSSTLMQAADLAGVHGLSFLAVLVNVALAQAVLAPRRALPGLSWAAAAVAAAALYGGWVLQAAPPPEAPPEAAATVRVGVVQGNVQQERKWDPAARQEILETHLRLTREAATGGAGMVVWPEASIPDPHGISGDPETRRRLAALARELEVAILFGSPHVQAIARDPGAGARSRAAPGAEAETGQFQTNAAFLLDDRGRWRGRYDKVELVPFGEYVPFGDWLGFLDPVVPAVADFRAGDPDQAPFEGFRSAGEGAFSVAICYEIVFPELVRRQVSRGATLLVTITNDAWYGDTGIPYQHLAMARLRAVENRRWLVRAANTGISAIIDPWGRLHGRLPLGRAGTLVADVVPAHESSPYNRWGLLFALSAAGCAVLGVAWERWPRWAGRRPDDLLAARRSDLEPTTPDGPERKNRKDPSP